MSINIYKQTLELVDVESMFFNSLYSRLNSAEKFYPNFKEWYYLKVIPDIITNKRDFIFENRNNNLVGLSLIKYNEKKLCTLKVFEEYQNKGFALKLFEKSFEKLETDKPFLTVSEEKYQEFKRIFDYYKFELTGIKSGLYRKDKLEYFFNEK